ncbi:hypothetical protein Tco_0732745 [Tanacetum coccineum]
MSRNRQKVLVDYFFNNDLKYLQGSISTMTYMTSLTKTKNAQYDLPDIEDMVPNIWVPVKVAYDKHALWGISHWREQRRGNEETWVWVSERDYCKKSRQGDLIDSKRDFYIFVHEPSKRHASPCCSESAYKSLRQ